MVNISPLTLLLQVGGALLLAVVLIHFYRLYRLNYLLLWSLSWWAFSLHLSTGICLIVLGKQSPLSHPLLRLSVSFICFFAGFLQIAWLLFGVRELATGRRASEAHKRIGVIAALLLTLIIVLPFSFDPSPEALNLRVLLRLTVRTLVIGIAFLGGAYGLLYGWTRRRSFGIKLTGVTFALYGLNNVFYTGTLGTSVSVDLQAWFVGFFEVVAQSAMGLGLVIWFLEEERDKALRATAALGESHARVRDLASRLIVAQEEERTRIARELHDDLGQQVASIAIGLGKLERQMPDAGDAARSQVAKLEERTSQLSGRIRRLSHELHSSTLEHVGIEAALRSYCAEFSEHEEIGVTFKAGEDCAGIARDVALCLYRVTQESLRNVAKHSDAKTARVALSVTDCSVELSVADGGKGFTPAPGHLRRGLGLVSMEERVRMLRGSFQIDTGRGRGTEVKVSIPLGG